MTEPINLVQYRLDKERLLQGREPARGAMPQETQFNVVYARVGETILCAARDGVQRHLSAQDIVREIREAHHVRLSVRELRLLLAARCVPTTCLPSIAQGPPDSYSH